MENKDIMEEIRLTMTDDVWQSARWRFAYKFRELTGMPQGFERVSTKKVEEVARKIFPETPDEKMTGKISLVNKWKRYDDPKFPEKDNLIRICKAYQVNEYYFYDDSDDFNGDYKRITEVTGLSSKAIAVLDKLHNNQNGFKTIKDGDGVTVTIRDVDAFSHITIDFLNFALEHYYNEVISGSWPISTIFSYMYDAIFVRDLQCSEIDTPLNFETDIPIKEITDLKFTSPSIRNGPKVNVKEIFQTYNTNLVLQWLSNQRDKQSDQS